MPYEKIGKNEPVCIADEVPFEIPESWEWVRFSSIIELQSGQDMAPDKYNANGDGIPYITGASNIENGSVIINRWTEYGKAFAYKGDLLLTCKGTVGTMAILDEPQVHIARQIMAIRTTGEIGILYIQVVLETLVASLKAAAKSMIPGIAREDVLKSLLPLPPYAEQKRIVSKLSEIAQFVAMYSLRENALNRLYSSFPDQLRKSILQMAVQGKLIPQDPTDEPASVLLERIRAEKQRLVKEGKIKKDKHESVIFRRDNSHYEKRGSEEVCIDDKLPFEIPKIRPRSIHPAGELQDKYLFIWKVQIKMQNRAIHSAMVRFLPGTADQATILKTNRLQKISLFRFSIRKKGKSLHSILGKMDTW